MELQAKLRLPGIPTQHTYHLIADSAFPCLKEIMTPYRRHAGMTALERKFNKHLSSKRQSIERSFGMLKVRFK